METVPFITPEYSDSTDRQHIYEMLMRPLVGLEKRPSEEEVAELIDLLFMASLMREEGQAVQVRLVLAPPGVFNSDEGPPSGWHVHTFDVSRRLTADELRRLSPAAGFFHSLLGVWREKDQYHIWGIINSGTNWMNTVHGGRRLGQTKHRYPILHLRDPGRITFYLDDQQVAEVFGHHTSMGGLDVFQANWLGTRFARSRSGLIGEIRERYGFAAWSNYTLAVIIRRLAQQFVRRMISLIRISSHGGTLLFLPSGEPGEAIAQQWLEPKYSLTPSGSDLRFRRIVSQIVTRLGQLAGPKDQLEDIWRIYRESRDGGLEELEESFFELARFYADFMRVDGALVLTRRFETLSFGTEIRVPHNLIEVMEAMDLEGQRLEPRDPRADGTRHRSVYRLVLAEPEALGIVISQDSSVRFIAYHNDHVTYWPHNAG
ncbi:MAG: hypothetical protein E1N59_1623 [Puniceicoccaceae bacterium 5H]|nr:MAG: hypothetical protein E1N59_1623 [Puniceicoccaceae bacterium 5H]